MDADMEREFLAIFGLKKDEIKPLAKSVRRGLKRVIQEEKRENEIDPESLARVLSGPANSGKSAGEILEQACSAVVAASKNIKKRK